jgi:hypothetical protein
VNVEPPYFLSSKSYITRFLAGSLSKRINIDKIK